MFQTWPVVEEGVLCLCWCFEAVFHSLGGHFTYFSQLSEGPQHGPLHIIRGGRPMTLQQGSGAQYCVWASGRTWPAALVGTAAAAVPCQGCQAAVVALEVQQKYPCFDTCNHQQHSSLLNSPASMPCLWTTGYWLHIPLSIQTSLHPENLARSVHRTRVGGRCHSDTVPPHPRDHRLALLTPQTAKKSIAREHASVSYRL